MSRYQKGKTNLDFTEATDSEWQWHQLGHMQVCTSLQTDNHASTPPLNFLQAGCPSCRPTNSVKALTAKANYCSVKVIVSTFRCSAPAVSLPKTVLSSDSVAVFKSRLKTFLFSPGFLSSLFSAAHCLAPAPLKLQPYGTIDICLLLFFYPRYHIIIVVVILIVIVFIF